MNPDDKHLFAVYAADLLKSQSIYPDSKLSITDEDVVHRILTVLRLTVGHQLILFDTQKNIIVDIADTKKNKMLTVVVKQVHGNTTPRLTIDFALPLLKREALEEAVYSLSEIGVTDITLIITHKSQKQLTPKELQRLHKIQIAAAEQSKNFCFPLIHAPVSFEHFCAELQKSPLPSILFDPQGVPAFDVFKSVSDKKITKIRALIGPEGGLTSTEIQTVQDLGFTACQLTGTVLRAVQAASVGAGMIASLL